MTGCLTQYPEPHYDAGHSERFDMRIYSRCLGKGGSYTSEQPVVQTSGCQNRNKYRLTLLLAILETVSEEDRLTRPTTRNKNIRIFEIILKIQMSLRQITISVHILNIFQKIIHAYVYSSYAI